MPASEKKTVAIVGGGLVGFLAALGFANKLGWTVHVFDSRTPTERAVVDHKVINLALSNRGLRTFRDIDPKLADAMLAASVPLSGRMVHDLKGNKSFQAYSPRAEAIYSINREIMNRLLNDAIDLSPLVTIHLSRKFVRSSTTSITLLDPTTDIEHEFSADLIIGADGPFSSVRGQLQRNVKMDLYTRWSPHSYIKIDVPPKILPNGETDHALEPGVLHIWPRKEFLLIAPGNPDKTFTCVLWANDDLLDSLKDKEVARQFFRREFPSFLEATNEDEALDQLTKAAMVPMLSLKCFPLNGMDRTVLVGDAAHTVVPYMGHGANVGYEDVRVLLELIQTAKPDAPLKDILSAYSVARREDLEAIDDVAWSHFKVLGEEVLTTRYLIRKKLDFVLNTYFPKLWAPLYASVMFDDSTPYASIVKREKRQNMIVNICEVVLVLASLSVCARVL